MKTKIFYTTNAGVYFASDNAEILVDGIHDAGAVGFPPMSPEMERQMNSEEGLFVGSGLLLFTHIHKDHYHATKVRLYMEHRFVLRENFEMQQVSIQVSRFTFI